MFETIADRLSSAFSSLTRKGSLTEKDVSVAVREIRIALLEADVSLSVVKSFIKTIQRKAVGQNVMRSVTPGQLVIKIVHDELVEMLSGEDESPSELKINNPPAVILMAGLQGSGKTTTTAKLAKHLKDQMGKRVLVTSLDTRRPAAMEQLAILALQADVEMFPIQSGVGAVQIAKNACDTAHSGGFDVLILDTAGRLHVDTDLMDEITTIRDMVIPRETLLVVDGLTGQDAVNVATEFEDKLGITGVILTRMDGDGRGGAALSMRAVTGKPIKFVGTGEKLDALDVFSPQRIAGRLLGMGDIVSLVEQASKTLEKEQTERAMRRMAAGRMSFNDLRTQLDSIEKMGGMSRIASLIPGLGSRKSQISGMMNNKEIKKQIALIDSMTRKERANPKLINASRRKRIAAGAGHNVNDLNRLLKVHRAMLDMGRMSAKRGQLKEMFQQFNNPQGASNPQIPAGLPHNLDLAGLAQEMQSSDKQRSRYVYRGRK